MIEEKLIAVSKLLLDFVAAIRYFGMSSFLFEFRDEGTTLHKIEIWKRLLYIHQK